MRLYLDANPIIYSIEGTSRLSRLACRVKPLRDGNAEMLDRFEGDAGVIDGAS